MHQNTSRHSNQPLAKSTVDEESLTPKSRQCCKAFATVWAKEGIVLKFPCQGKMPIYEYWCDSCRRIVTSYRRSFSVSPPHCPHCGNSELKRIFSTFSVQKTYKDVYEDILSDRELSQGMMRDDPRAIAEWNRRMTGGKKAPPEYEEITKRMEGGEWPVTQIEERRKEFSGEEEVKPEISE